MKIDTILFDLDNTLFDFNKAERIALTKALLQMGADPTESILHRFSQINLAQWKLLEQGKLNRNQVKIRRFQLLFDELNLNCDAKETAKVYESLLGMGHYFMEGAEQVLRTLSPQYHLYLVTNGTASVQRSRMKSAKLERYLKDSFISEEIGFDKPSKEYFSHCFQHIPGFQKQSTIIVGDSLTSDIQGGKNAGIRTVWFNPSHASNPSDIIPDYEIAYLKDLPELVQSI
ncbi:Putative HAD-hydrolase YfnB [Eubacteriaceae bacterium CHKCI005]|nr:Putative HAD-hydrolase YfnB [Eubacteriaceae bacterium CHKCI005]